MIFFFDVEDRIFLIWSIQQADALIYLYCFKQNKNKYIKIKYYYFLKTND